MNISSPEQPLRRSSGRNTRTSKKAIRPPSPEGPLQNSQLPLENTPPCYSVGGELLETEISTTPTHPNQLSPEYSCPVFPYPTISQLNDYPNLTVPNSPQQRSVIVTLPHSAPVSPINSVNSVASIHSRSQSVSSVDASVILANPGFLPLPPPISSRFSTPLGSAACSPVVGSWDNYLEQPTYKDQN